jgi:DNA modification methylase
MLLHGDSTQVLKDINDESIDLLITDPPYGIEFMGKDWDKALSSIDIWKECYRVLKTGKLAFIMCSPRQDVLSRMIINLEDAGFRTNYTSIYWTYASGFPKAANVSKLIDKRNGRTQETYIPFSDYLKEKRLEKNLSMKQIDRLLNTNTAYSWWEGRLSGIQLPTKQYYLQLKQILDLDNRFDELIEREEAEREIIGQSNQGAKSIYTNQLESKQITITKPATEEAQRMEGAYVGFQPKPAVEVILVISKGKTLTWLDDCRIPYQSESDKFESSGFHDRGNGEGLLRYRQDNEKQGYDKLLKIPISDNPPNEKGRFPANLLVSDDVLNDGTSRKAHINNIDGLNDSTASGLYAGENRKGRGFINLQNSYDDEGSYSRYFDLDKWYSKALNSENNRTDLSKESISVNNVEKDLSITKAIEGNHITSVQRNVMQYSDLENQNQNVNCVEKKQHCTEINTVQNIAPIKQDMGILQGILHMLESELTTLTMQQRSIQLNQSNVSDVLEKLTYSIDTIQTSINQLRLYGCVDPAIIEQMQQALTQDLHFQKLPLEIKKTFPFLLCAKASKSEKNKGISNIPIKVNDGRNTPVDNPFQRGETLRNNSHPTVKPVKLFSYLITMGSRENDLILDPFCGSGTTLISAHNLHRKYIGIEINKDYVEIAKHRLMPNLQQHKLTVNL